MKVLEILHTGTNQMLTLHHSEEETVLECVWTVVTGMK